MRLSTLTGGLEDAIDGKFDDVHEEAGFGHPYDKENDGDWWEKVQSGVLHQCEVFSSKLEEAYKLFGNVH